MSYEITQYVNVWREYLGSSCIILKISYHQKDIKRVRNWLVGRIWFWGENWCCICIPHYSPLPLHTHTQSNIYNSYGWVKLSFSLSLEIWVVTEPRCEFDNSWRNWEGQWTYIWLLPDKRVSRWTAKQRVKGMCYFWFACATRMDLNTVCTSV